MLNQASLLVAYSEASPSGLVWLKDGSVAGYKTGGYWSIKVDNRTVYCHRIVYFLHHGSIPDDLEVDHRDKDSFNNEIDNLRLATRRQQQFNTAVRFGSVTGIKGVGWWKARGCWRARVKLHGKEYSFYSANQEECIAWARSKREELHGEFHRH